MHNSVRLMTAFLQGVPPTTLDRLLLFWHNVWEEILKPEGLASKVIAELLIGLLGILVFDTSKRLAENWRKIKAIVRRFRTRRKLILFWVDLEVNTAERIKVRLRKNFPFAEITEINSPDENRFYPMSPSIIEAIVLINTDVTKLSSNDKDKEEIEARLKQYVQDGGGIVATHDVVYRRSRNEGMYDLLGGKADRWELRTRAVEYEKTIEGKAHPIGRRLPDEMNLADGEVLCVDWAEGTEVLFREKSTAGPGQGLLVSRKSGKGRVVWLNSCDRGSPLATTIGMPGDQFLEVLTASIQWVSNAKPLAVGAPLIVAHRGVSAIGGENTMQAFQAAIDDRADFIETDVWQTADGVLVLHHDAEVGVEGARIEIAESAYAALEIAAIAQKRPLARLEDLLLLAKDKVGLDLELKGTGYEREVADLIRATGFPLNRLVITSFSEQAVRQFKICYGEARCGLLMNYRRPWKDLFPERRIRSCGADFVAANDRLVRLGFAGRLARAGLPVWVWTVNDSVRIADLLQTPGVEAIITDAVNLAIREQAAAHSD